MTKSKPDSKEYASGLFVPGELSISFIDKKEIEPGYSCFSDNRIGFDIKDLGVQVSTNVIKASDIPDCLIEYGDFKTMLFEPAVDYLTDLLSSSSQTLEQYGKLVKSSSPRLPSIIKIWLDFIGEDEQITYVDNPCERRDILQVFLARKKWKEKAYNSVCVDADLKPIFESDFVEESAQKRPAIFGETLNHGLERAISLIKNEKEIYEMLKIEHKLNGSPKY